MSLIETETHSLVGLMESVERQRLLLEAVKKLPEEIQELDAWATFNPDTSHMTLYFLGGEEILKKLKVMGFQKFDRVNTRDGKSFSLSGGIATIGEVNITAQVSGLEQPAGCTLVPTTSMTTTYEVICEKEDGEESDG